MPPINRPSLGAETAAGSSQATPGENAAPAAPVQTTYRGTLITIVAKRNARGAWLTEISATCDGKQLDLPDAEPISEGWLTEAEALREGVERGRYLVDRSLPGSDSHDASAK